MFSGAKSDKPTLKPVWITAASLSLLVISGCVSSTLDSKQLRPVGGSSAQNSSSAAGGNFAGQQDATQANSQPVNLENTAANPEKRIEDPTSPLDPVARDKAIAEMRAKAASGSGKKTRIGALPETSSEPMDAQKQRELAAELERSKTNSENSSTDAELENKKKSIEALRRKANSHYSNALKRIED